MTHRKPGRAFRRYLLQKYPYPIFPFFSNTGLLVLDNKHFKQNHKINQITYMQFIGWLSLIDRFLFIVLGVYMMKALALEDTCDRIKAIESRLFYIAFNTYIC